MQTTAPTPTKVATLSREEVENLKKDIRIRLNEARGRLMSAREDLLELAEHYRHSGEVLTSAAYIGLASKCGAENRALNDRVSQLS